VNASVQIRAVTFDVGGTLIQPWPSVGHVYADVARRHGLIDVSVETLNQNFAAAWRAKKNFQHTHQDWAGIVDATFVGMSATMPSQTFFQELYERFARPDAWRIYDDVFPALDALASRDIRLAIISNWDERLRPLLRELRLNQYFEALIISCETGFIKPSPVIFSQAAEKLGLPPQSILHVGDSFEMDVQGARSAGMRSLQIQRGLESRDTSQIGSLSALHDPLAVHACLT
jgi:putative hydrolase of the HAD superfamily